MPWDNANKDKPLNAIAPAESLAPRSPNEVDSDALQAALGPDEDHSYEDEEGIPIIP